MKKWLKQKQRAIKPQTKLMFSQDTFDSVTHNNCVCDGGCPRCKEHPTKQSNDSRLFSEVQVTTNNYSTQSVFKIHYNDVCSNK